MELGDLTPGHGLLLVAAALAAGAINAIAGGGSLVSFPALLAAGYPALTANVTNTVALVPGYVGGSLAYRAELKDQRGRMFALGLIGAVGGLTGAILLVASPAHVFRQIVPWLILFSCLLLAAQRQVTRLVTTEHGEKRAPPLVLGTAQFLSAVYGGYFGAGLGVMMLAFLGVLLHDTLQRLNALKGVISLAVNLTSAVFFAAFGPVEWLPVVLMAPAALLGGNLGVFLARRLSSEMLRGLVILFGVVVAVRLLLQ